MLKPQGWGFSHLCFRHLVSPQWGCIHTHWFPLNILSGQSPMKMLLLPRSDSFPENLDLWFFSQDCKWNTAATQIQECVQVTCQAAEKHCWDCWISWRSAASAFTAEVPPAPTTPPGKLWSPRTALSACWEKLHERILESREIKIRK